MTTRSQPLFSFLSIAFLLIVSVETAPILAQADTSDHKNVLVFYDENDKLPGLAITDQGIRSTLASASSFKIDVYNENLDRSRIQGNAQNQLLSDYFRQKYSRKKIDVIIAVIGPSLDFLLEHAEEISPGTPIVFCGVDRREIESRTLRSNVTGVLVKRDFKGTLDVALRLQPNTRDVVFIAGTSDFDKRLTEQAVGELREYQDRLAFKYLTNGTLDELLTEVSQLPPNTIVLISTVFRDGAGQPYVPHDVVSLISQKANAPVYGFLDQYLGRGIVGGHLYSLEAHGKKAAELALRILEGQEVADIPIVDADMNLDMFDWRQLQRWGISEASLPEGSIVEFKQPTVWEEYKWYAIGLIAVVIMEALLIGWLLYLRLRRHQAETEAARLSGRLTEIVSNVPGIVWESRTDPANAGRRTTFISDYVYRMLGYTSDEWMQKPPGFGLKLVPEEERERVQRESDEVIETGTEAVSEFRWFAKDGGVRWVENHIAPIVDGAKGVVGLRGVALDVTNRKIAEEKAREAEEKDRAILAAIPDLMFIQTNDGVFLDYHAKDPDELLVSPESFLGKNMREVLPADLATRLSESFARAKDGGEPEILEYSLDTGAGAKWFEARMVRSGDKILSIVRDVSDRKAAEEALRESESLNRTILSSLNTHVCVLDGDGRIISVNHSWAAFALDNGLPSDASVGPGVNYLDVCQRAAIGGYELAQFALDGVRAVCDGTQEYFQLEYPCHSPDEKRWFVMIVTPLKGIKGGAVVAHNDITDSKLAAEAVRESEKRFRNMAETAPVIIWMSDEEQSTTYLNRQWMEFTGSDLEKETGLEWTRHVHPDDLTPTLGIYNDAFERREPFELEFRARRADGAYRWLVASGAPRFTREGIFLGFIGIGIDITERKAAEEALQQSELRLRMAQQAARVGTWEWDIETGTSVWSEMIWELLRLEPNDRDITVDTFVEFIHPEDRERALGKVNEVIADGDEYYDEFRVIRADGSILWLASKGALIRSDDGKPERVLGVNIDITELKRTQHEAQELSGRLISAYEDERARLARELHDDACQNLALLSIELELLERRPPTDGECIRSKLKGLSERASELSSDLRRMSHQLHPARLTHLGLAPAIRGFCNEMESAQDLKIDFAEANIPPTLPESTSLNIYRIIQESLQNTVKHSGASEASVILSANGNALQLTISDNGCGFDPKISAPQGSLGLISMRERVRLLHGTISIDSRPDSGTRIEVTIPI